MGLVHAILLIGGLTQVVSERCKNGITSDVCSMLNILSNSQQAERKQRDNCQGDIDEATEKFEKRKPNFIRFGRAAQSAVSGKKDVDPNFIHFGHSSSAFTLNGPRFGIGRAFLDLELEELSSIWKSS